jgi:hypothetical protein
LPVAWQWGVTIVTEYRITTYSDTSFVGTHYSVDKEIDGVWIVYKLFLDKKVAKGFIKSLTALNETV